MSKHRELSPLALIAKALESLVDIARKQIRDPYGLLNVLTDAVLLGILVFSTVRYFAGSVSGQIDLGFMSAQLDPSSTRDVVVLLVMAFWVPVCVLLCLRTFTQLDPFRRR